MSFTSLVNHPSSPQSTHPLHIWEVCSVWEIMFRDNVGILKIMLFVSSLALRQVRVRGFRSPALQQQQQQQRRRRCQHSAVLTSSKPSTTRLFSTNIGTPATSFDDGKSPFQITTPIYYVNDVPHIGHAYTSIGKFFFFFFWILARVGKKILGLCHLIGVFVIFSQFVSMLCITNGNLLF